VKYYLYISDAKIDMLFPQVPHQIKKKTASEFKLDLKLFSASRKSETETEVSNIARLEAVVEFIREFGNLGTLDEPDEYVADTLPMRWGNYAGFPKESSVVYFGGQTEKTIVGLGGSMKHLIGSSKEGDSAPHSHSATPFLMEYLLKELDLPSSDPELERDLHFYRSQGQEFAVLDAVYLATTQMRGLVQNVEFLAKRLASGPSQIAESILRSPVLPVSGRLSEATNALLATPLYIAMAD